jgi:coenzyme F420-reducing hydrogenase delta subunit
MFTENIEVRPRYIHVLCSGTIELEGFVLALNRGLDTAARVAKPL